MGKVPELHPIWAENNSSSKQHLMLMLAAPVMPQSETATAHHEIFLLKYRTGNACLEGRSAVCRKDEGKGRGFQNEQ